MMTRTIFMLVALTAFAMSGTAKAACYADYKAKRDNPLRLHYGIIELPDAACEDLAENHDEIQSRIKADGWQLLNVLSIFGADQLEDKKESAGDFFLRF